MAQQERIREAFASPPDPEYLRERQAAGWRLAAIEWVRDAAGAQPAAPADLPYGVRIAGDCLHLEEDPVEKQALVVMLEMIVQDTRLTQVASELNRRGFRTRQGQEWSPGEVFNLMPRLIEVGPRVFSSEEWIERRPRLLNAI